MRKNIKAAIIISVLILTCFLVIPMTYAQDGLIKEDKKAEFNNNVNDFADKAVISRERSLEQIIGTSVKIVLTTLGTIFIALMFVAGNTWMQAAGNEEKIKKSKARIQSLIVGLVIVLLAYALSNGFAGLLAGALLR